MSAGWLIAYVGAPVLVFVAISAVGHLAMDAARKTARPVANAGPVAPFVPPSATFYTGTDVAMNQVLMTEIVPVEREAERHKTS